MSFLLTIVLTFSLTLAWFFDADWASNYVTMAGAVGIEIREQKDPTNKPNEITKVEKDAGGLHFNISTNKAYPGQAIEVNASVYNNGGSSGAGGSPCYIRARFKVITDIGNSTDEAIAASEAAMNAQNIYNFLQQLVESQNAITANDYCWRYYKSSSSRKISASGTSNTDTLYYFEGLHFNDANNNGKQDTGEADYTASSTFGEIGYFYLCYKTANSTDKTKVMHPLPVQQTSMFLWNDTFIIPWTLTNYSADKHIYVAVIFQAIQTFIPSIDSNGVISPAANNQAGVAPGTAINGKTYSHYALEFDDPSLQTVFNSCYFGPVSTRIPADTNGDGDTDDADDYIEFNDEKYGLAEEPTSSSNL